MVPTDLLIILAAQRDPVPFPAVIEVFIMEITFEILREASLRMPKAIGATMSIVECSGDWAGGSSGWTCITGSGHHRIDHGHCKFCDPCLFHRNFCSLAAVRIYHLRRYNGFLWFDFSFVCRRSSFM